jgi:pantoate--beta-alanine ligase
MSDDMLSPSSAQAWCAEQRRDNRRIGYVATMGALHEGHLSLIRQAREENDVFCVSIFVNPLQFDSGTDFEAYPRDLPGDLKQLRHFGCGMVFSGTLESFFPENARGDALQMISAGDFGQGLEGDFRPGHLDGVRTIVKRLFQTVGPCQTYFGEKDFQQTLVVTELAQQLGYPQVVICPTLREPSGLALSSRNILLDAQQTIHATGIYAALVETRLSWREGVRDATELSNIMVERLASEPLFVEYAEVRDPNRWTRERPTEPLNDARALIAAHIGRVRLIDNLCLSRETS